MILYKSQVIEFKVSSCGSPGYFQNAMAIANELHGEEIANQGYHCVEVPCMMF